MNTTVNEEHSRPTQCKRVIEYIKENGSITQDQADKAFGCKRLPSRINELRKQGIEIVTITKKGKNRFGEPCHWAEYRFAETDQR